MKGISCGYKL